MCPPFLIEDRSSTSRPQGRTVISFRMMNEQSSACLPTKYRQAESGRRSDTEYPTREWKELPLLTHSLLSLMLYLNSELACSLKV